MAAVENNDTPEKEASAIYISIDDVIQQQPSASCELLVDTIGNVADNKVAQPIDDESASQSPVPPLAENNILIPGGGDVLKPTPSRDLPQSSSHVPKLNLGAVLQPAFVSEPRFSRKVFFN